MDAIGTAVVLAGALLLQGTPPAQEAPPAAPAVAAPTPSQRLAALKKEFEDAQRAFDEKYSAAKTDEERQKIFSSDYPSPEAYAERFSALAKEQRGDAVALEAWTWVVQRVQSRELLEPALAALASDHVGSPKLVDVVQAISPYNPTLASEEFLRTVIAKSPHSNVTGNATFKLATVLGGMATVAESLAAKEGEAAKEREGLVAYYGQEMVEELAARDPAEMRKEAEDLFEDVLRDFKAVKSAQGTLGAQAEAELFELRNLAIGRVAPDIVGQDVDGVTFKLSDYRGKVVVLDFWGFW
jgi:hypothetical protein